ncbi:MAG: hypothetical protein LHV68_02770 [Elusimicrobia bacterium]|nr:hypothetical protein [Candidatus Liberimonas magnetica]
MRDGLSEYDKARITISENDEREDLLPVDRGLSYKWAMEAGGKTQEALAADLKKTHAHVSQYVAAVELSWPVREIVNRFTIGIAHINQISRLPNQEAQIAMAERVHKEELSVKQLESLVNKALSTTGDIGQGTGDSGGDAKPQNKKMYIKPTKSGFCATLKFDRKRDDAEQAIAFTNDLIKQIKEQVELAKKEEKDKGKDKVRDANERAVQQARELQRSFDELKRMNNPQNSNTEAVPAKPSDEVSGNPFAMFGDAQANDIINNMQQALSMPGISEADAARLKEGIQKMQEMLKVTRKSR